MDGVLAKGDGEYDEGDEETKECPEELFEESALRRFDVTVQGRLSIAHAGHRTGECISVTPYAPTMESEITPTAQDTVTPEVVAEQEPAPDAPDGRPHVSEPSKLIRIASMTRAMLDEVREAPLDEAGRQRLVAIYDQSIDELREVLSDDLVEELDAVFIPITDVPSEAELRIAQAQLVGWLEGLFHGIQASLISQQMAASAQLERMRTQKALEGGDEQEHGNGLYL